jgi:hypothetical protein
MIESLLLHPKQIHTGNIAHGTTSVLEAFFPGDGHTIKEGLI